MIRRPTTILALLTALNLLNYLDRYVVSAVLPKLQEELALSNFVGGLLATVFLIGYFLTSPIFGTLADRGKRKGLIALGVAIWSIATIASGFATGTVSLLLARAMVGVGEASYATLAPTIIDDLAPPGKKSRWLAVFFVATPIGSALGYLIGGAVEHAHGWRAAFFVAGGPGLVAAGLCLLIAEPSRKLSTEKADVLGAAKKLLARPLYRRGVIGYSTGTFAIGAFAYWAPKFIYKAYDMPLGRANFVFGLITVVGGAIGTGVGGVWADRRAQAAMKARAADSHGALGGRYGEPTLGDDDVSTVVACLRVCAVGSLLAAPLALAAFLSPSATPFFVFCFFCEICVFLSSSPINAVLLRSVPSELRASALALAILMIHLFGDLWSPPLVGLIADYAPMRFAMMILPIAFAASGIIWWVRPRPSTVTTQTQ